MEAVVSPDLKRCPKCDEHKDRTAFARAAGRYDGLQGQCRECSSRRRFEKLGRGRVQAAQGTGVFKNCERCGAPSYVKPYQVNDPKAGRFCSVRCRNGSLSEAVCTACGVTFTRKTSQFTRKDGRPRTEVVCSWACLIKRVDRVCEQCGETYNTKRTQNLRFCSKPCHDASMVNKIERECQRCNKVFTVNQYRIDNGHGLFCSIECRGQSKQLPSFTLTCEWCRKDYELTGNMGHWREIRKFCSAECRVSGTGKTSNLETQVAGILDGLGVAYEPQYPVGRLVADFYVSTLNLILEVNGCYWHACPECDLPQIKPDSYQRSERREARLVRLGYRVLVVWQHHFWAGAAEQMIREAVGMV